MMRRRRRLPSPVRAWRVSPGRRPERNAALLGRPARQLDPAPLCAWLSGKTVLVTGAGGSIGAGLCRHCAALGVRRLVLVEIDELALLQVQEQLQRHSPALECVAILGDCGDPAVIAHALRQGPVDAVIHAAAYKHVPLLETQLREAVRNNVLATDTVALACHRAGVGCFVLVSTDKAVAPVSVLGASKRLAEKVCTVRLAGSRTRLVTVRFGNVLDSAGSVLQVFRAQIQRGGPVTVTHPQATRYFMTIDEACQLILLAAAQGRAGAVYSLDMGPAVSILTLARHLLAQTRGRLRRRISIVFTGLRPGDRLHEPTVVAMPEAGHATGLLRVDAHDGGPNDAGLLAVLARLRQAVATYDLPTLRDCLHDAVPDYAPQTEPAVSPPGCSLSLHAEDING